MSMGIHAGKKVQMPSQSSSSSGGGGRSGNEHNSRGSITYRRNSPEDFFADMTKKENKLDLEILQVNPVVISLLVLNFVCWQMHHPQQAKAKIRSQVEAEAVASQRLVKRAPNLFKPIGSQETHHVLHLGRWNPNGKFQSHIQSLQEGARSPQEDARNRNDGPSSQQRGNNGGAKWCLLGLLC